MIRKCDLCKKKIKTCCERVETIMDGKFIEDLIFCDAFCLVKYFSEDR
ncbi:MAG: hypothetical protein [Siphoviridae sp. ctjeG17]|nr:MAG: hypothetical protein [Siphoviridae sp. ctjeG17]